MNKIKLSVMAFSLSLIISSLGLGLTYLNQLREAKDFTKIEISSHSRDLQEAIKNKDIKVLSSHSKKLLSKNGLQFVEFRNVRDIVYRDGSFEIDPIETQTIKFDKRMFGLAVFYQISDSKILEEIKGEWYIYLFRFIVLNFLIVVLFSFLHRKFF